MRRAQKSVRDNEFVNGIINQIKFILLPFLLNFSVLIYRTKIMRDNIYF